MKYLRGVVNMTKGDRIRNETVRKDLESNNNSIQQIKMAWELKMDDGKQTKTIQDTKSLCKRKRERPNRWEYGG